MRFSEFHAGIFLSVENVLIISLNDSAGSSQLLSLFLLSAKNVVRISCDTEKNAHKMLLQNSLPLGTSLCTLYHVLAYLKAH